MSDFMCDPHGICAAYAIQLRALFKAKAIVVSQSGSATYPVIDFLCLRFPAAVASRAGWSSPP